MKRLSQRAALRSNQQTDHASTRQLAIAGRLAHSRLFSRLFDYVVKRLFYIIDIQICFLSWLYWPPDEKRTTKAHPKTWGMSLTFSFATNYQKCVYVRLCKAIKINQKSKTNSKYQTKSNFANLMKMWLLRFIQKFPCDRPSRRLFTR